MTSKLFLFYFFSDIRFPLFSGLGCPECPQFALGAPKQAGQGVDGRTTHVRLPFYWLDEYAEGSACFGVLQSS